MSFQTQRTTTASKIPSADTSGIALHLEPIVQLPSCCQPPNLEVIMTREKISLASAAAIAIISWGALVQKNQNKGVIPLLDPINGKISLQRAPAGTVGAAGSSP